MSVVPDHASPARAIRALPQLKYPCDTEHVRPVPVAGRYRRAREIPRSRRRTDAAVMNLVNLPDAPFPPTGGVRTLVAEPVVAQSTTREMSICRQKLRVDVRKGDGTGTPLVMCSGLGSSFEVLQPLVDALDPGTEVIRFDVPGVGGSPAGPLPYGFPQVAWLMRRMLDELGYDRVDVLGFSWGGALAQQFAVQHHGSCRRLVLVSTSTGVLSVPAAPWVLAKLLAARDFRDYAEAMAASLGGGATHTRPDDVRQLLRNTRLALSGRGFLYQLAAVASWTSLPFLGLIRQPALVIAGDVDPIVPAVNARILATLIPHATCRTRAGTSSR